MKTKSSMFPMSVLVPVFALALTLTLIPPISPDISASELQKGEITAELGIELGPGAGEIADQIAAELDGEAEIFIYEASELEPVGSLVVSTIMFLEDKTEGYAIHNLPLRTTVEPAEAEELAKAVNAGQEADYLWLNLSYFIEVVDLYDGVTVETAAGSREMDAESALDYLNYGLEEDYPHDRLERQEAIMWGLEQEMQEHEGLPDLGGMFSLLAGGLSEIETSLDLFRGIELGVRVLRRAPDDVEMYQPDAPDYGY